MANRTVRICHLTFATCKGRCEKLCSAQVLRGLWVTLGFLVCAVAFFAGCSQGPPASAPFAALPARPPEIFADVTAKTGIEFTYRNGEEADQYTMVETLGGGVALIDYDRDGWLDIFVTG